MTDSDNATRDKFLQDFERLGENQSLSLEEIMNKHSVIDEEMLSRVIAKTGIKKKPESYAEVYFISWFLYLRGEDEDAILKKIPGLKVETLRYWITENRWEDRKLVEMHLLHQKTENEMAKLRNSAAESVAEKVSTFVDRLEQKIYASLDGLDPKDLLRQFLPAMKLSATLSGEMDNAVDDAEKEKIKGFQRLNEALSESKGDFTPTKPIVEARIITDAQDTKPSPAKGVSERTGDSDSQTYTL